MLENIALLKSVLAKSSIWLLDSACLSALVSNFREGEGRESFGLLSLSHECKVARREAETHEECIGR